MVSPGAQAPKHGKGHHQEDSHRWQSARVPNPLDDQDRERKNPRLGLQLLLRPCLPRFPLCFELRYSPPASTLRLLGSQRRRSRPGVCTAACRGRQQWQLPAGYDELGDLRAAFRVGEGAGKPCRFGPQGRHECRPTTLQKCQPPACGSVVMVSLGVWSALRTRITLLMLHLDGFTSVAPGEREIRYITATLKLVE